VFMNLEHGGHRRDVLVRVVDPLEVIDDVDKCHAKRLASGPCLAQFAFQQVIEARSGRPVK